MPQPIFKYFYLLFFTLLSFGFIACDNNDDDGDDPDPDNTGAPPDTISICNDIREEVILANDPDKPVDYYIPCDMEFKEGGILRVEAGTVLEVSSDKILSFDDDSEVHFDGTSSDSITIRGQEAVAGYWQGILIEGTNNPTNSISYTRLQDAGSASVSTFINAGSGILLERGGACIIDHSSFTRIDGHGLVVRDGADIEGFTANSFSDITLEPALIRTNQLQHLDNTLTFSNLQEEHITAIYQGTEHEVNQELTIGFNVLPIRFIEEIEIPDDHSLTLEAGVEFILGSEHSIQADGPLRIQGTEQDSVHIGPEVEVAGGWNGIYIGSDSPLNTFEYAIIEYGGGGQLDPGQTKNANIWIATGAALTAENCRISNADGWGVITDENAVGQSGEFTQTNLLFYDNPQGNVGTED